MTQVDPYLRSLGSLQQSGIRSGLKTSPASGCWQRRSPGTLAWTGEPTQQLVALTAGCVFPLSLQPQESTSALRVTTARQTGPPVDSKTPCFSHSLLPPPGYAAHSRRTMNVQMNNFFGPLELQRLFLCPHHLRFCQSCSRQDGVRGAHLGICPPTLLHKRSTSPPCGAPRDPHTAPREGG